MPRLEHISPDTRQVAYYLSMLRCFRLLKFTCQNKIGSSNMLTRWVKLIVMAAVGAINIKISLVSVAFFAMFITNWKWLKCSLKLLPLHQAKLPS